MGKCVFFLAIVCTLFFLCNSNDDQKITCYHPETLQILNEADAPYLTIQIPDGYHVKLEKGTDFLLYYAVPIDTTGLPSKATLGMYVGHFPNPVFPEGDSISIADSNVGARYEWKSWIKIDGDQKTIVSDALDGSLLQGILPRSNLGNVRELQLHFFITATDEKITRLLMRSAESVQLVKK